MRPAEAGAGYGATPAPASLPPDGPARPRPRRAGARAGARRARRRGRAHLAFVIVVAWTAGGLAWASQGTHYVRGGTLALAGAMFVAALARLLLPEGRAGLLASRWRYIDVAALAALAVGLLVAGLALRIT